MKKIFYLSFFLIALTNTQNLFSQDFIPTLKDTTKQKKNWFEFSFGQSMLFISNSKQVNVRNQAAIVVPTSSMLFFIEARPTKIVRIPFFANVPTESKQFLVNGQIIYERASPTFGTGIQIKCLSLKLDDKSSIDFSTGPLASLLLTTKNSVRFAPILAARVRIKRGENFVMYIGTSYSFGINTWGLLYGTGTIF